MNIKKEAVVKGLIVGGKLLFAVGIVAEAALGLKGNPILEVASKLTTKK